MMKTLKILFVIPAVFALNNISAQLITNQKDIGTVADEYIQTSIKLSDNNYLISAYTFGGASGDKTTASYGIIDSWIIKVDPNNVILWQKSFGGSASDEILSITETPEGNILLGIASSSNVSGNKTVGSNGVFDYWVLKLDPNGNVIWQKNYGSIDNDDIYKIEILSNTNYLLTGLSSSNIGGDKTENSYGGDDFWIVSIDSSGTVLWDKTIGGSGFEGLVTSTYNPTNFLIYIVGSSDSNISGNKTENGYGSNDFWVVSMNLNGQIINQKTVGGTLNDEPIEIVCNSLNEVFIVGYSESDVSGNKTASNFGNYDYWVIKLSSDLNIIADYSYGGTNMDTSGGGLINSNNELLIYGSSSSGISGVKNEITRGGNDCWILSVEQLNGNINWQKTIGGNLNDGACAIFEMTNSYKIIGGSVSGVSADKTVGTKGLVDFWLFNLDKSVSVQSLNAQDIEIYPNPFTDVVTVQNALAGHYQLLDTKGAFLLSGQVSPFFEINLFGYPSGVYFLQMTDENNETIHCKLIKH